MFGGGVSGWRVWVGRAQRRQAQCREAHPHTKSHHYIERREKTMMDELGVRALFSCLRAQTGSDRYDDFCQWRQSIEGTPDFEALVHERLTK